MPQLYPDTARASSKSRQVTEWVVGFLVLGAVAVAAGALVVLLQTQDGLWSEQMRGSANLSRTLARSISLLAGEYASDVRRVENNLSGLAQGNPAQSLSDYQPSSRALGAGNASIDGAGLLAVLDQAGNLKAASGTTEAMQRNFAERAFFTEQRDRRDQGTFVGWSAADESPLHSSSLVLSRRLNDQTGGFAGVVAAFIPLSRIETIFGDTQAGPDGSIALLRLDGMVLTHTYSSIGDEAKELTQSEGFKAATLDTGSHFGLSSAGGTKRLYSFNRVPGLPLVVVVATDFQSLYEYWWHKAAIVGAAMVLLCAVTVALCIGLGREVARRDQAERALRGMSVQMAMNASLDGLTGLANRASFDERLTREWNRAKRTGMPIAVLLINPDGFREYNERFGPTAGDQLLLGIARLIASNVLRPGDLSARYSGSEFAVLLPDTDALGSAMVAERVRSAVESHTFGAPPRQTVRTTVSIGLSVGLPRRSGDTKDDLVKRAETGLNEAKRDGHNRVGTVEPKQQAKATFGTASTRRMAETARRE